MIKLFLDPDELANRAPIIVLLTDLVTAARDAMSKSFGDPELDMPLMSFKDEVLGVFTVGLKATSSRQPALAGLKAMVNAPTLLADDELGFIVHNIDDMLQADSDDGEDAMFVSFLVSKRYSLIACTTATIH
jgi:DNA repair/transcription protein MET18/MMS19